MILLVLGLVLLGLWFYGFGPVSALPWWALGVPFVAAALWWAFADASGLTARIAMARYEARRALRRRRAMEFLGLLVRGRGSSADFSQSLVAPPAPADGAPIKGAAALPSTPANPGTATPEPVFSDTVPSMIDVPPDIGIPDADRRVKDR